jgi:hypothetical protein
VARPRRFQSPETGLEANLFSIVLPDGKSPLHDISPLSEVGVIGFFLFFQAADVLEFESSGFWHAPRLHGQPTDSDLRGGHLHFITFRC